MARGSVAKTLIGTAILQVFPGSFIDTDGKTIRIPTSCEGDPLEIKITMTAAKDIVGGNASFVSSEKQLTPQDTQMTDEEVAEVRRVIEALGL